MRKFGVHLINVALVALFACTASGVHLHAETGHHADKTDHGIHLAHGFSADHTRLDHDDHVDLDLTEAPLGFSAIDIALFNHPSWYVPIAAKAATKLFIPPSGAPPPRHTRIRPPLRAPPLSA